MSFKGVRLSSNYVVVFFTLTDRASTIPSNIRGYQSGTWSAGQETIRGTSTKLQREHENKENKNKTKTTEIKEQRHKAHARKNRRRAFDRESLV